MWLAWASSEVTLLTTETPSSVYYHTGSCLIKHSITCLISGGKWRSHLKFLGALDKQNVILTEIQLTSLTSTGGSLRVRCSILNQSPWLQCLLLSISSPPKVERIPYTEWTAPFNLLPILLATWMRPGLY